MSVSQIHNLVDPATGLIVPPPRIVGGYNVDPAFKYPSFVSFQRGGSHSCGGTLYNGNTVITAAHCSTGSISGVTFKVHRHDLTKTDAQENGATYKAVSKVVHPNYKTTSSGYDVAIWKIDNPKTDRYAVDLDDGTYGNSTDTLLTAIGWGTTSSGGSLAKILQEVKLPVYDHAKCQSDYKAGGLTMTNAETQICAGFPEGQKDTCQGDSGGPVFVTKDGRQVLVGLTSYGIGCARPKFPGVYARVSALRNWILANV
jgi:trypsin